MAGAGVDTIGPAECDDFGHVSVFQGESGAGPIYQCKTISHLFGGGLYDSWLGAYLEDLDTQDIDRIFRQEEAQAFKTLLEGLEDGTKTWRDVAAFQLDFLADIPEMVGYYDTLYSQMQINGLYEDIRAANGNPERLAEIFAEYENSGIETNPFIQSGLASTGSATAVLTGTIDNSILEQIIRDAALGDGILGGEVDFEDLPGYGGIWDGLIRHIKVIGRGINLPIPDWLPLPGIFELPTIGEIFDTVTGPWKEAAQDALRNCMAGPDGEAGTEDDKLASQCMEEQSVIDILVEGIGNATEGIWEATGGKVQDIFEEDGIVDRCTSNPSGCAQEVFDKLKDIFGEGAVDPTSTGGNIPDWMKVIIIGGAYGDEILGELEDLFGGDINDDGTIGITDPNTFDCSSIGKSGGMVPDASYCGDCSDANQNDFGNGCEPVCQYNNAIPASSSECKEPFTDTGPTQQDCDALGRTHIPGDAATQTPSACGGCKDDINTAPSDENDPMSECVRIDDPNAQEGDPCNTGAPLNAEGKIGPLGDCIPNEDADCTVEGTGEAGKIENGECVAGPGPIGPDCSQITDENYQECGKVKCADGTFADVGQCPEGPGPTPCQDPNRETNRDGSCGDTCKNGDPAPATGLCPEVPPEKCTNGATNYPDCDQCPTGQSLVNGQCIQDSFNCDQQDRVTNEDGSCGECKPGFTPDPEGFDQCIQAPPECNDCSCAQYAADNPAECTTCPEGQSYCAATGQCESAGDCPSDTQPPETGGGGGAGGGAVGGGGGRSMFEPYSFAVSADPQLLAKSEFPITDFLAGIFTNSRGGRNV